MNNRYRPGAIDQSVLATEWARVMAPRTGDVRTELVEEAAEFLGISTKTAWERLQGAGDRFREEWIQTVSDATDSNAVAGFYNQSDTELFELLDWHASDPMHYRTLTLRDVALDRPGRHYLDYGSGIGCDAFVFAEAGFEIVLADISDCLLAFAGWRCRRRGFRVQTIDLKHQSLPVDEFDVVVCFDVLEHIPDPVRIVRSLRQAMHHGGLLAIHAPFGTDAHRPMHVVHSDIVTPRMRSLGFQPFDCAFPPIVRAPQLFEKELVPAWDRAGYYLYDHYLKNNLGACLATIYRHTFRRGRRRLRLERTGGSGFSPQPQASPKAQ